jgi:hypothetical protein
MCTVAAVKESTMAKRIPGQLIAQPLPDGTVLRAPVYNEHEVRTAAGLTLAAATIAFCYAYFEKRFLPIKVVSTFFFVEFAIRVFAGFQYTPTGLVSRVLMSRREPMWVSAKPKRFAWSMGLAMGAAMTFITNSNIHGLLPRTICLICIALMWFEAAMGVCIGCEIHAFLVRRGWATKDDAYEICAGGVCEVVPRARRSRAGAASPNGDSPVLPPISLTEPIVD